MNFIPWNIVRKDLHLTRFYLVVWWGLLAAGYYDIRWCLNYFLTNPLVQIQRENENFMVLLSTYFSSIWPYYLIWVFIFLAFIVLAVIVDLIIKVDSPIDERAEWRTRPVSGLGVWRAKIFYLGLFCFILPGIVFTLALIQQGGTWPEARHLLLQWFSAQTCLIAMMASAGVLFRRTFSGLLVFSLGALGAFLLGMADDRIGTTLEMWVDALRAGLLNAWIALGIFVITGLVVTALAYDGRRRTPCRVVLGGGVLAALLALWFGPYDLLGASTILVPQREDRVSMTLLPETKNGITSNVRLLYTNTYGNSWIGYYGIVFQLNYQPEHDEVCWIYSFDEHLALPAPFVAPRQYPKSWVPWARFWPMNLDAAVAAAGYGTLLGYNSTTSPGLSLIGWSHFGTPVGNVSAPNTFNVVLGTQTDLNQLGTASVKWQGIAAGAIGHLELVNDLPYAVGTTWRKGFSMYKIESLPGYEHSNLPLLNAIQMGTLHLMLWEANANHVAWLAYKPEDNDSHIFLLYNPQKKQSLPNLEYMMQDRVDRSSGSSLYTEIAQSAIFDVRAILGDDPFSRRTIPPQNLNTWVADHPDLLKQYQKTMADWLAGAHLIELRFVPDRAIHKAVTLDSISLDSTAPAQAASTPAP